MTFTKFAITTLLTASFASASFAHSPTQAPVTEIPPAEAESSEDSRDGILLSLLGLAVIIALISSDGSSAPSGRQLQEIPD